MSSKFLSLWRDPHGVRTSSLSRTRRRGGGQAEGRVHHAEKDFKRASKAVENRGRGGLRRTRPRVAWGLGRQLCVEDQGRAYSGLFLEDPCFRPAIGDLPSFERKIMPWA